MARFRLCKHCGDLHELGRWPHNCAYEPPLRADYPAPYIVSDTLPGGVNGMRNMLTGRQVDSKHAYYKAVRRAGCEIVGNDPRGYKPPDPERFTPDERDIGMDIKRSIEFLTPLSQDERDNFMRDAQGVAIKGLDNG